MCPKYVKCQACGRNQGKKSVNMEHKCFILTKEERDKIKKRNVNGEIKNQTRGYIFFLIMNL